MNISGVNAKLTGQDILSIINEFVDVEGLDIKQVTIDDGIMIEGSFTKGININFMAKVQILKCENNKVYVKLAKVKILKLGIFRIIRSFALKQLSKLCSEFGISNNKEVAVISVDTMLKDVPYVNLKVRDIYIRKDILYAELDNIEVSIAGTLIKNTEDIEDGAEDKNEEKNLDFSSIEKIEDNYSRGREVLKNRMSEKGKKYSDYIFIIPDIISLVYRLLKDKRVPLKTKIVISASLSYTMFPCDIIPDKIPFIGKIDDISVVFFALNKIIKDVSLDVIVENWQGKNEILLVLTSGLDFLTSFTNIGNVEKLYEAINEISEL
ncbi:MAG: YkvA family protein [Clostridium sp.]|nr:YkvA family protein [Clostridium sp.]